MPQVVVKTSAHVRMLAQQPYNSDYLIAEAAAKAANFGLVAQSGFIEIVFRLWMEFVVHPPRRERRRSNTSGPGTPFTFPSTSSRYRR